MEKSVKITLIIVLGIVILGAMIMSSISSVNPQNTVSVNGQSEIQVMPDLITIYFGIETQGTTSKQAEDKNSEISDLLKQKLIEQGFEKDEIQTTSYNIYPNYDWNSGTRKINGYKASHTIRLEIPVTDSEKLGAIIDSATESNALISSINFELTQEKQNQYKSEVLKLAAQDAKIKAEAIAQGMDKKLGKLVSTSDNSFYYSPWRVYGAEASQKSLDESTANITPSEQTITAGVTAVFKIR